MRRSAKLGSFGVSVATVAASVCGAASALVLLSACGSCDSVVRQTAMPLFVNGTFDGVEADQAGHRIFLADGNGRQVDVVDMSGGDPEFLGAVAVPGPPKGLAYSPGDHRLYAGLDNGQVAVIDAAPRADMAVVDTFTVDPQLADLVDYSPQTQTLFVGTADSHKVVTVDTKTDTVINSVDLGAPVEQPRYDPADGKLYVTVSGKDSLVQIDPRTGVVTRQYYYKHCHPTGLAINPSRQLAMVACHSSMLLFNLRTGLNELNSRVPGGDLIAYDAAVDRFTVGSVHGPRDSTVGVFYGDGTYMAQVQSTTYAHEAVFNDATGVVYAPSPTGLLSFSPTACAPAPAWLRFMGGASVFFVPLAALGLSLFLYARRKSRRDPNAPRPPTWEELQKEDLENERRRVRELEDAIYGPESG